MSNATDGTRSFHEGAGKKLRRAVLLVSAAIVIVLALPASVFATSTETWVSGTGKDSGTCTITAPCASFQYAISETSPNGEIDVLTSGSYGALTINEPVTIFAGGVTAEIQFTGSYGIYIDLTSATPGHVVLHGLDIDGEGGKGTDAIYDASASPELTENEGVEIEDCDIHGFSDIGVGVGDEGTTKAANSLTISHTTIEGGELGVRTFQSASRTGFPGRVVLDDDIIDDASEAGVFTRQSETQFVAEKDLIEGNKIGFQADTGPGNYTLSNDEIEDNTIQGVILYEPAEGSSQLVLDDDQINDNGQDGVSLAGVAIDALLEGDDIDNNEADGLEAVDPVGVTNSSLSGNKSFGVYANGAKAVASLAGDTITQNTTGLEAVDGGSIVFYGAGNSVFGNTINGTPSSTVSDGAVGPTGPTGPAGAKGSTGATGATGANGSPGPAGTKGTPGAIGPVGPTGPTGANGAQGPAGEIELVTCTNAKKKVKHKTITHKKCTSKLISSPVSFNVSAASATITRAGHVDAIGSLRDGKLILHTSKVLRAGRYTLKLTTETGTRQHVSSQTIAVTLT